MCYIGGFKIAIAAIIVIEKSGMCVCGKKDHHLKSRLLIWNEEIF